jgi:tetratricopeptide (TPR) repeat protein
VQLDPKHFESYRSLDWVLAKQGKWDAVVEHWNRFLALQPNHARAYLERGGTFFHKRDLKRAFEDAQKACQLGEQEACARTESLKQRI